MSADEQAFWLDALAGAGRYKEWLVSRVLPHIGGSVLEIGCGTGTFTRHFAAAAKRVLAIDIDAGFVASARRATGNLPGVTVERADATTRQWDGAFDTVVMLDVLEHIADDAALLRSLHAALKPGGRLVLKVPAHRALFGPMDSAVGHRRRYSRAGLEAVLTEAGFDAPETRYFNAASVFGWWLNGKVLRRTIPGRSQIRLFDRLVPVLRAVEEVVSPPFGLSLIAAARRG